MKAGRDEEGDDILPRADKNATRLLVDGGAKTYDEESRTCEAVISVGSPVQRDFGTEVLRITPDAIDLSRLSNGGIPLLDSHNQSTALASLGRVQSAWVDQGALWGKLKFHDTEPGRQAEKMVARGEINAISAGYRIQSWEVTDKDGRKIDPDVDRVRWDDDLIFTACAGNYWNAVWSWCQPTIKR